MYSIRKYDSTPHIEGSRHQLGDSPDDLRLDDFADDDLLAEEKIDGANSAISFDEGGDLLLQSRGHYLTGGPRERHFSLFKTWAATHAGRLLERLEDRFIMYGEYAFAKHTVFYDRLPHYFLEFDVFDRHTGLYLSTDARHELLNGLPIMPVPVLAKQRFHATRDLQALVRPSLYKSSGWREAFAQAVAASGSRPEMADDQTDPSDLAEGLYLKHERDGQVLRRCKFVRADFLQTIQSSDSHWHERPIIQNLLAPGIDIFAPVLGIPGAYDALAA